jgi:protocatechuate 3,4-dioxygenase beta subunit
LQIIPSLVATRAPLSAANSGIVKGVIEDAQGRAVPRAIVNLRGLAVARTDSRGAYTFTRVPPGVHQLMAFKNGLKVRSEQIQVAPDRAVAARFKLAADPAASRRAADRPILSKASAEQSATLRGIITDLGRQPIAGAKLRLSGAATAVSVRTQTDGSFELSGMRPGTYRLLAGKTGYADSSQTVTLVAGRSEQRQIRLTPATLPLRPEVFQQTIRRMGEVRGQVSDRNRQPLANVTVELKAAGSSALIAQAKTNARGEYVMKALPGRYTMRILAPRFGEAAAGVAIESQQTVRKDFELRAGGSAGGAAGRSETTGQLSGAVSEEQTGRPIVGASVTVGGRHCVSDSTGEFVIRDLSPGVHRATVSRAGYVLETTEVRIRIGEAARVGFRLRRAENSSRGARRESLTAQVSGRVLDERSAQPIAGASVTTRGNGVVTDREGNFTITGISPGNHQVTISRSGYAAQNRAVALRAGQNLRLIIRLAAQKPPRQSRQRNQSGHSDSET